MGGHPGPPGASREYMTPQIRTGQSLIDEMNATTGESIRLWWLGHSGFAIKSCGMVFYIDPCLATPHGRTRSAGSPLQPELATNADMVLCTHVGPSHMESATLNPMLAASPRARLVLPKSASDHAHSLGVAYQRMATTDSDLRIEYFKNGFYGRVYAVPSAHPELNHTPLGGYPCLGYLIRFGTHTIYHAGDCRLYDGIVDRLRPYRVTVALLPINGGRNFDATEAAELAEAIGARWLAPMHYGTFEDQSTDVNRFIDHMLGYRPSVGFKVFQPGEGWTVPESE